MAKGTRGSVRVEIGQVRVNPEDTKLLHASRIRVTKWLEDESPNSDNRYRPARLGAVLSLGQFSAWAVRYAIIRGENNHNGWPERILIPNRRAKILEGRCKPLCACRIDPTEAKAFRKACLSFLETICEPGEKLNQSTFLTLAVVGFAECVRKTPALRNLPMPPWAGHFLFKDLPPP